MPLSCTNCGQNEALEGHPTPLCAECRQAYIKYPIPIWIKLFAVGLLALIIFASFSLPKQLVIGLHMARGKKAEKAERYRTAEKEFLEAERHMRQTTPELNGHLFICAIFNGEIDSARKYVSRIDSSVSDDELPDKMQEAVDLGKAYLSSDNLSSLYQRFPNGLPDTALYRAVKENPRDESLLYVYAATLYNEKQIDSCTQVLWVALDQHSSNIPLLTLAASISVERKRPDSAVYFCDRLLDFNKENIVALAGKARNLMRLGKDKEAAPLAEEAYRLEDTSTYTIGTMALLYHVTSQSAKRDEMMGKFNKLNRDTSDHYVADVINGKESFGTTK